eukprot:jgi/Botrbrau1/3535/Bobra.341_2s0061.1
MNDGGAQQRRFALASFDLGSSHNLPSLPQFSASRLHRFLTRDNHQLRDEMLSFLESTFTHHPRHKGDLDSRDLTRHLLRKLSRKGLFCIRDYVSDPARFWAAFELLPWVDQSLAALAASHFSLCGGVLASLGSPDQVASLGSRMETFELPGCLALLELGNGSNLANIQTMALFDLEADEFVIHTPRESAAKHCTQSVLRHAHACLVVAQLEVGGVIRGPHVFWVPLRAPEGGPAPGVCIRDCSPDLAQVTFKGVRVPRSAMLTAVAEVLSDGSYVAAMSPEDHCGLLASSLTTGQILTTSSTVETMKVAMRLAVSYACHPTSPREPLIHMTAHQQRLVPALATTFAYHFTVIDLKRIAQTPRGGGPHVLSALVSGLTTAAQRARSDIVQLAVRYGGSSGLLAGRLRLLGREVDADVALEEEVVPMQQLARAVMDKAARNFRIPTVPRVSGIVLTLCDIRSLLIFREQAVLCEILGSAAKALQTRLPARHHKQGKHGLPERMQHPLLHSEGQMQGASSPIQLVIQDAFLHRAEDLGTAFVDRWTFRRLLKEAAAAPAASRPTLEALAVVHGIGLLEKSMPFYLEAGVLGLEHFAHLRREKSSLCAQLCDCGGQTLVLLCEAFGIPSPSALEPSTPDIWPRSRSVR